MTPLKNVAMNQMYNYYELMLKNTYNNDISKVFIPYRPILEMELFFSSLLAKDNYEYISSLPFQELDAKKIFSTLELPIDNIYYNICERYFSLLRKIIPVANRTRKHRKITRYGNVNAYSKSRIAAFYALDRFKIKLLILKNFLQYFREHHYLLSAFPSYKRKNDKSFPSILFSEYQNRMQDYFESVTWKPEYSTKRLCDRQHITHEQLCQLIQFHLPSNLNDTKYIARSLKSSYFICKSIFEVMDVTDPFESMHGSIEKFILNRDFLPSMIESINQAYRQDNVRKIHKFVNMFDQYLGWIIEGINHAIEIASNHQICLDWEETVYYNGNAQSF